MNEPQDIKLPFLVRPETPTELPVEVNDVPLSSYAFQCFPDGSLFRYGAHPDGSGKQCLLDFRGAVVGVVAHKAIADFLVRGAHCLCCILRDEAKGVEPGVGGSEIRPASGNIKVD